MQEFSREERIRRAFQRTAYVMRGMWEETGTSHSRLLDVLIPPGYVTVGKSVQAENIGGKQISEHVVPLRTVCLRCYEMFATGASDAEVATEMARLVRIVQITPDEKQRLDRTPPVGLGLKQRMPKGWRVENGDIYARLTAAGIQWTQFDATP